MYAYIKGILDSVYDENIVVENNGIGYLIKCPLGISSRIGQIGDEVKVFLYQSVSQDDISLCGFATQEEKDMFLLLITVSGIGPKAALGICAQMLPDDLAFAVMNNDVAGLTKVKGLGKKGAERIILELRDKVKKAQGSGSKPTASKNISNNTPSNQTVNDAVEALMVLGYKPEVAEECVNSVYDGSMDLKTLIRNSLRAMAK